MQGSFTTHFTRAGGMIWRRQAARGTNHGQAALDGATRPQDAQDTVKPRLTVPPERLSVPPDRHLDGDVDLADPAVLLANYGAGT